MTAKVGTIAARATYYSTEPAAVYYSAEAPFRALGRGAAQLGLGPGVTPAEVENLLWGFSADGSRKLVMNAGVDAGERKRDFGREILFSPDKSVSVLYGVGPPPVREAVRVAHWAARDEALAVASRLAGRTRIGKGGRTAVAGDLIFLAVTHDANRLQHPLLHDHVIVVGTVVLPDGSTRALDNRPLYRAQAAMEKAYQQALHRHLIALGVRAGMTAGKCVVAGVPQPLLKEFSARRRQVLEARQKLAPDDRHALQKAAIRSRDKKVNLPAAELRARWREAAARHGYDPRASVTRVPSREQVEALTRAGRAALPAPVSAGVPAPDRHERRKPQHERTTPAPRQEARKVEHPTPAAPPTRGHDAPGRSGVNPAGENARGNDPAVAAEAPGAHRPATGRPAPRLAQQGETGRVDGTRPGREASGGPASPTADHRPSDPGSGSIRARGGGPPPRSPRPPTAAPSGQVPLPTITPRPAGTGSARGRTDEAARRPDPAGPTRLATAATAARVDDGTIRLTSAVVARSAVKRAVKDLAGTFAHFTTDAVQDRAVEVLRDWATAGRGRTTPDRFHAAMDHLTANPARHGLVPVTTARGREEQVFATKKQWRLERKAIAALERLVYRGFAHAPARDAVRRRALAGLSAPAADAAVGVACSPSRLGLIDGPGRSGKTAAARAAAAVLKDDGRRVFAVAPTARGAEALARGTDIPGLTVAGLNRATAVPGVLGTWRRVFQAIRKHRFPNAGALLRYAEAAHRGVKEPLVRFDRNTVIVVDDAHRVPTRDLLPLLDRAAAAGAKVVLVGDSRGVLPARPSGLFAHAATRHPAVSLGGPEPARSPHLTAAVAALRRGHGPRAVEALARGRLLDTGAGEKGSAPPARDRLLDAYARGGYLARPGELVVLAPTSGEAREVNRAVQALRAAHGQLGRPVVGFGPGAFRVGDRVVLTRTDRKAGVYAGQFGTLTGAAGGRVEVRLDDGRAVRIPATADAPLQLGYAAAPGPAANHTFREAFVLAGDRLPNQHQALALLARVTDRAVVFADRADVESGRLGRVLSRPGRPGMAHAMEVLPPRPERDPTRLQQAALGYGGVT